MEVDIAWPRKRPIQEEEYQAKKRFLSEQFFNLRISQSDGWLGQHTGRPLPSDANGETSAVSGEEPMEEDRPIATSSEYSSPVPSFSALTASSDDDDDDDTDLEDLDVDTPAPRLYRFREKTRSVRGSRKAEPPLAHVLQRGSSSMVDEKVDEMVRSSRHRLLAEASVDAAPDLCRALIVYKPLPLASSANSGDGEAGGDPTPAPPSDTQQGAHEKEVGSSASDDKRFRGAVVQDAGSGTSETPATPGGERPAARGLGGRISQSGGGVAHSADDGAGAMSDVDVDEAQRSGAHMDVMEVTTTMPCEDDGVGPWQGQVTPPVLTREGTSRGAPTPGLTPDLVELARRSLSSSVHAQEPGEEAGGPRLGSVAALSWGR